MIWLLIVPAAVMAWLGILMLAAMVFRALPDLLLDGAIWWDAFLPGEPPASLTGLPTLSIIRRRAALLAFWPVLPTLSICAVIDGLLPTLSTCSLCTDIVDL